MCNYRTFLHGKMCDCIAVLHGKCANAPNKTEPAPLGAIRLGLPDRLFPEWFAAAVTHPTNNKEECPK